MAARKRTTRKTGRRVAGARGAKRAMARVEGAIARAERELPASLREFSARVRKRLGQLERSVLRAEERYQKQALRVLRNASHQLGRFEAEGERRWKTLTATARRDALTVLRRMEKALASTAGPPRRAKPRKVSRKRKAAASATKGIRTAA